MNTNNIPRRPILLGGATLLGSLPFALFGQNSRADEKDFKLTKTQQYSLEEALKDADKKYDPQVKMITSSVSGVGYHTTLKAGTVHPTRTSLEYAIALLDSGEPERLERAKEILRTIISLQDQNPANKTYGIWSWYLEEPLEIMSPPDWNWADFCGAQLLAAWIDHNERLGIDLAMQVRESIVHAANSIRKRNVSLGYTNIAIMGTYVTLAASDRFGLNDLQIYAKDRLRRYHKYLFQQGSFNEYNSPTYSIVAIKELTRMLMHVRDEDDLKLIRKIHDFAWKHATCRFHAPTGQWSGPHSRCYSTLLREREKDFLEFATGEQGLVKKVRPLSLGLDSYRLVIQCPKAYYANFQPRKEAETVTEVFAPSKTPGQSIRGTTFLHPHYSLGTINRGDFWNQRRPFVAYWGTAEKPACMQLRFLHDGYDYCSALPFTHQDEGCALTAVVFTTDYGDTHPSLDRVKNATIRAKDLRMRFEFGGSIDSLMFVPFNGPEGMLFLKDRNVQIQIRPIIDPFGEGRFRWEIGQNKSQKWVDATAYSGEEKEINFNSLKKAFLAFAFQICTIEEKPVSMARILATEKEGLCHVDWIHQKKFSPDDEKEGTVNYQLEFPTQPAPRKTIQNNVSDFSVRTMG